MTEHTDKELLALFRDEQSRNYGFNLLMRQHQQRLYGFVRRMVTDPDDAKDVLQNTFIKAWHGLETFREDSQLYSWLYRIAHNESINHLNKKRRMPFVNNDTVTEQLCGTLDKSEHFSGDAIQQKLQRAVMRLPTKQRAVFIMKYFEAKKYTEISAITGTTVGALKATYHIAVKKIEEWVVADQTKTPD
ncbi:MAG: sigma-70 family RNA polymerase sigma factor [Flavobacteriales bacterium]|nr:sigma-70 family RNA polymerase sigma factor [Flavobacteriales bacterium]